MWFYPQYEISDIAARKDFPRIHPSVGYVFAFRYYMDVSQWAKVISMLLLSELDADAFMRPWMLISSPRLGQAYGTR